MSRSRNPETYAAEIVRTPLFQGLTEEETVRLMRTGENADEKGVSVLYAKKGELIYSPTGFQKCIGVLLSGSASVTKQEHDSSMLMSILSQGDVFGAATLYTEDDVYVAYIRALESTWCLMLSEEAFRRMMEEDFRIAENYMRYLTKRIRFLSGRIDGFIRPTPADRVYAYMAKNAEDGVFTPKQSIKAIGDALCISRATLYRALDELEQTEQIQRDGKLFRLRERKESE